MSFIPPLSPNTPRTRATTGILKRKRLKSLVREHNGRLVFPKLSSFVLLDKVPRHSNHRLWIIRHYSRVIWELSSDFSRVSNIFPRFFHRPKVTLPSNIYFLFLFLFLFFTQKEFLYERIYTKTNITLAVEDHRHHPRAGHVMNTNATPAIFTEVTIELLRLARSCSRNLAAGHYAISLEHRSLPPSTTSTAVSTTSSSSFRVRSALSASGNTETRSSF